MKKLTTKRKAESLGNETSINTESNISNSNTVNEIKTEKNENIINGTKLNLIPGKIKSIIKEKSSEMNIINTVKKVSNTKVETKSNDKSKPKLKQGKLEFFNIKVGSSTSSKIFERPEKGKTIKIYSWNVNGIRSIIEKGYFEYFIKEEDPDILCLNETKINLENLEKMKINKLYKDKYLSYWNCAEEKNGYSGVCIFTKFEPIKVTHGMKIDKHDGEGRVITIEFDYFFLISVYTPNSGVGLLKRLDYRVKEWDVDFRIYVESLREKKTVIIAGDLNVCHKDIDIHDPKGNQRSAGFTIEERNEFTKLLETGYIDTFRLKHPDDVEYTYFSSRFNSKINKMGWRLDYFLINKEAENNVIDSQIEGKYDGSDHCPIKLTYKI